jgi:hypothetical protein
VSSDYKELEELAMSVGAGVVLIGNKNATSFPFSKKSLMLSKLKDLRDKKGYQVTDTDDHKNKNGNNTLAAALLVSYITDLETYGQMMNDDNKNLRSLCIILFGVCIFLVFTLLS